MRNKLDTFLNSRFGVDSRERNGAKWFKLGRIWEPGVLLSWGHRSEICQVDLQGQRLQLMSGDERNELIFRLLGMGMKPTRIDGAMDWVDQNVDLCDSATASCLAKELCLMRKYAPKNAYTSDGLATRKQLDVGDRSSDAYGRFYDKGLEQRVAPAGYWERLEIEFKGERSPILARALRDAGPDWASVLTGFILGAVEFREMNGRSERNRRPMAAWWQQLTGDIVTIRPSPRRFPTSFHKWREWFRSVPGPRLVEFATAVDTPVEQVVKALLFEVGSSHRGGPIVNEFIHEFPNLTRLMISTTCHHTDIRAASARQHHTPVSQST